METLFVIFALGVVVSLLVAKGMLQASEYANQELEMRKPRGPDDKVQK